MAQVPGSGTAEGVKEKLEMVTEAEPVVALKEGGSGGLKVMSKPPVEAVVKLMASPGRTFQMTVLESEVVSWVATLFNV